MFRTAIAGVSLAVALTAGMGGAFAGSSKGFMETIGGRWVGPGEIVAGKYLSLIHI